MNEVRIEIENGSNVQQLVDSFYERNGSNGRARDCDTFFLAFLGETLVGCVRYCIEEETSLLRTMRVGEQFQKKGIGRKLLETFGFYLDHNRIHRVFCLPYTHLENFYAMIGFEKIQGADVPQFLTDRLATYRATGKEFICMRRP